MSQPELGRVLMLLENSTYPRDPRVRNEATALTEAGYRVSVIAPAFPGQPLRDEIGGVRVYRFPAPPRATGALGYVWEYGYSMLAAGLLSLVVWWREGFDVVHAHNPPDTFCVIAAVYKVLGKRFVFDHHDLAPEMYRARFGGGNSVVYRLLAFFERLSCRLADRVIATNASYRDLETARGGVPAERISIVRNGPDLARIRPVAPDPELRAMGRTVIGFVGSMGHLDGLNLLLEALHRLKHELGREDWFAVLVGTGDAWSQLQAQCERLGLVDRVRFTGRLADTEFLSMLCAADICVDPDPSNPFNDRSTMIKMMEYMALAKPIVAFDLPEHRVTAGDAAVYAQPNDTLDFARQITLLMDDPARRAELGRIGQRRVEQELGWSRQIPQLLAAYAALLGRDVGVNYPIPGAYGTITGQDNTEIDEASVRVMAGKL